jgi:hypothetical protein
VGSTRALTHPLVLRTPTLVVFGFASRGADGTRDWRVIFPLQPLVPENNRDGSRRDDRASYEVAACLPLLSSWGGVLSGIVPRLMASISDSPGATEAHHHPSNLLGSLPSCPVPQRDTASRTTCLIVFCSPYPACPGSELEDLTQISTENSPRTLPSMRTPAVRGKWVDGHECTSFVSAFICDD